MTDGVVPFPTEKVNLARKALSDLFSRHDRILLAFSGGKESIALARLCEPYEGRFRLLWANTGFMFPHVEDLIRQYGERFGLDELRTDLVANWKANGLPARILPMGHALQSGGGQEPQLQADIACCSILRVAPLLATLQGLAEPTAVIHGQRHPDKAPGMGMSGWPLPACVEVSAPLADWSTAEVMEFLAAEDVALPDHYVEVADSLDCWACPAAFGEERGPARAAYMRRAYPQHLDAVMPGVRRTRDAVRASLDGLELAIDRAGLDRDADPAFVMQWAPLADDCMVAALATVLGRSYAETATILGVPLDPATGQPTALKGKGLQMADLGAPMLSIGLSATLIVSTAAGGTLEQADMRRHLTGRPAVLGAKVDKDDGSGRELHALAWTGTKLFDCRGPQVRELNIEDVAILAATILSPLAS